MIDYFLQLRCQHWLLIGYFMWCYPRIVSLAGTDAFRSWLEKLTIKILVTPIERKERSDFSCMSRYPTFFPLFPSTCDWLAASFLNPDWFTKLAGHTLVPHSFSRQPKSLLSFLSMIHLYFKLIQIEMMEMKRWWVHISWLFASLKHNKPTGLQHDTLHCHLPGQSHISGSEKTWANKRKI